MLTLCLCLTARSSSRQVRQTLIKELPHFCLRIRQTFGIKALSSSLMLETLFLISTYFIVKN